MEDWPLFLSKVCLQGLLCRAWLRFPLVLHPNETTTEEKKN